MKNIWKSDFNQDDHLPLNEILKLYNLTIIVRSVFSRRQKVLSTSFFRWMFVWIINARVWENWCLRRNWC